MSKPVTVKVAELVFDWDLYIRPSIDTSIVRELIEAEQAGEKQEPIVGDRKSRKVIDGWHRCRKELRLHKDDATIEVIWKDYKNQGEMLEDSIRLNARRGRRLDKQSHARIAILAKRCKLKIDVVAAAMGVTREYVEGCMERTAIAPSTGKSTIGEEIALKRTTLHMAGKKLTKKQVIGNTKAGGHHASYYVRQLLNLIENNLLDKEDEQLMELLQTLHQQLDAVVTVH